MDDPSSLDPNEPLNPRLAQLAFRERIRALSPRFWVTPTLIAANALVFAVMLVKGVPLISPTGQDVLRWGGNFGPATTGGEWWRLASCMFVHIGLLHIAFNMYVLFDAGRFVERLFGSAAFLVLYLLSGLGGSVVSLAVHPETVSAGASGAVFGVYGGLGGFLLVRRHEIPTLALASLRNGVVAFLGYNLLFAVGNKGIDLSAHLGGLAVGVGAGAALAMPLTAEGIRRRTSRILPVAVAGLALISAAAFALPRQANLGPVLERFQRVETAALAEFNGTVQRVAALAPEAQRRELAQSLEERVLPPWKKMREELEGLGRLPDRQRRIVNALLLYVRAREDAWGTFVEAVHQGDAALLGRADERAGDAEAALAKLNALLTE